jgi:hypothetical protein
VRTVRHFWPQLSQWLDQLPDTRFQPIVVYDRRFLFWWGAMLFLGQLRSRRQLDFELREAGAPMLANLNRLAGTEQESLPVDGTLDHFLGHLGSCPLATLRSEMIRRLIRMKALDDARLWGHFVVAVDGTGWLVFHKRHCERCLTQKHGETTVYLHYLVEAKLVGPSGTALSMGTEFVENAPDRPLSLKDEEAKQDCELMALQRLAPAFRKDFPQLRVCLTSDSLYACGRSLALAQKHDLRYVFTFKEGRLPSVWEEFQRLADSSPENRLRLTLPEGTVQVYRWVSGLSYEDAEHRLHTFNALECVETRQGVTTRYAWITDFPVSATTVVALATKGGRARSVIENQGFNVQKNSDLNLEHAYSMDLEKLKAYYFLLQIAHLIFQLLEVGSLLRSVARRAGKSPRDFFGSLRNMARRLVEALRYFRLPDDVFDLRAAASIQIRLTAS